MDYSERFLARQRRGAHFGRAVSVRASQLKENDLPPGLREASRPPPEFFKQARALSQRASVLAAAYTLNGADLAIDRYVRNFLQEFNSRVLRGEGNKMPQSFNVLGGFVDPDETTLIFRLLEERPYLVSLDAILDHMTDPARTAPADLINELDELVIYEFNMLGGFSDFAIPGHDTMACCGVAFVREHDELAIMGLFGQRVEALKSTRMPVRKADMTPGKEFLLDGQEDIDASDHPLFGRKDYTPVILMMRVSLPDRKVLVRYAFQEKTDMFLVHTDDAELLEELAERKDGEDRIQAQLEEVERYAELFRLIAAIPEFLTALEAHDDLAIERHPTKLKTDRTETAVRKVVEALKPSEVVNFVNVKALYSDSLTANTYATRPPDFHIERGGHWKRLDFGEEGADRQGRAVQGKTWVTKQASWRQSVAASAASGPIDVAVGVGSDAEETIGEIYVMRSGAHPKDWYKIGFTRKTSDDRAGGLSATSGQPDHFNVIQSWRVREPRLVEHRVHGRLAAFRTNAGREFFCLKYSQIRECVETVIHEMGALVEAP